MSYRDREPRIRGCWYWSPSDPRPIDAIASGPTVVVIIPEPTDVRLRSRGALRLLLAQPDLEHPSAAFARAWLDAGAPVTRWTWWARLLAWWRR